MTGAVQRLEARLGHHFTTKGLVELALTHRSYAAENRLDTSYERLEFLGDAVLQLAVTRCLYDRYPELAEGELAKVRASVVNQRTLAVVARDLGIGPTILLGRGEELSGGRDKDSILADIVESLLGAVYLEVGYDRAAEIILRLWTPMIIDRAAAPGRRDFKTRLQEQLAQRGLLPRYEISESGPDHAKVFAARVWAGEEILGEGSGTSKKRAEQAAAHDASTRLLDA